MCVHRVYYQHIWKIKERNLYLSLNNWEKVYEKSKRLRGVLSNRRLIEDDLNCHLKQRFRTEIDTIIGENHKGAIVI
jgi:hypothetical protein